MLSKLQPDNARAASALWRLRGWGTFVLGRDSVAAAIGPISASGDGPASIGPPWCSATQ